MNKKMSLGLVLMVLGATYAIHWRLQSARLANYDNFDPGYYLILPGLILYLIGLNKISALKKIMRILGNVSVCLGGFLLPGLGQYIGGVFYWQKELGNDVNLTGLIFTSSLIPLSPIIVGTIILLWRASREGKGDRTP